MLNWLLKFLRELGLRFLTDQNLVRQLAALFHLTSTSRATKEDRELAYISQNAVLVGTNLDSEISSLLSEAQAVIEALEKIKALKLDARTDAPSEIRVEGIRQQVNSHNTHFKIGKIDPAWIGDVDLSPLRAKVKELQDAHYRLKHPNDINPIEHQLKWISDDTKQWRPKFSCLIDDEAFTPPQPVLLGASAPVAAAPRNEFTARFVAYLREEEREVEQMLKKLSKRSTSHLALRTCRWRHGVRVRMCLTGRAITVANPEQEFVWEGSRTVIDFDVQVDANAPPGPTVLKFDAFIDGFVVATLRVDLEIRAGAKRGPLRMAKAEAARSAFASYSSTDRQRVLDRLASLRISAGLDPFVDCLSLHPGEEWKLRLAQEIRACELFLLFWSQSAAQSEWVSWEWHTALAEKAEDAIQLHPLEIGVKTPKELAHRQYDDAFMALRKAYEQPGAARPPLGE